MKNNQYGWICPQCGAVMAPSQISCVNCKGNLNYNPPPVTYEPAPWWMNPAYRWEFTCKTSTPLSTTISTNPNCTITTAWASSNSTPTI